MLLDEDTLLGTRQWLLDGEKPGEYVVATQHFDEPILAANYEERKHHRGFERWGEGRIHSRVPHWQLLELVKQGVVDPDLNLNTPCATRWFNSSANVWRIRHGRI